MPTPREYRLSPKLLAAFGGAVLCLSAAAEGAVFRLHRQRPGATANLVASPTEAGVEWVPSGSSVIGAGGVVEPEDRVLTLVRIDGPIEQRAGYHDVCAGWSDGHDAIADRLEDAFEHGDVLLVIDSPGGAAAGLQQAVARALAAKERHGRRCIVFADELVASAAFWWAAELGDEIYTPRAGQLGSIGARAGHVSIAAALAKDGVKVTDFAWPNDGKIALAPHRDLGPEGQRRGQRDVDDAGEAFCAAVCGSQIGRRHGLTRDAIVALGADVLTGDAAVAAGLADGVASLEEVTAYALALAQSADGENMPKPGQEEERNEAPPPTSKSPGSAPPPSSPPPSSAPPSSTPAGKPAEAEGDGDGEKKCSKCGEEGDDKDRHCSKCGTKFKGEEEEEAAESKPPVSSQAAPSRPDPAKASASLAEIIGLKPTASLPAQKVRAMDLASVFAHASKLTGHRTAHGIVGALTTMSKEAGKAQRLATEKAEAERRARKVERWDLAKRLVACDGEKRGKVFRDRVGKDGQRVMRDGKPVIDLAPQFAEMRLTTLRQLVADHEASTKSRNPFEPDERAAKAAADAAKPGAPVRGEPTEAQLKAAMQLPLVKRIAEQTNAKIEDAARAYLAAAAGGAQ